MLGIRRSSGLLLSKYSPKLARSFGSRYMTAVKKEPKEGTTSKISVAVASALIISAVTYLATSIDQYRTSRLEVVNNSAA